MRGVKLLARIAPGLVASSLGAIAPSAASSTQTIASARHTATTQGATSPPPTPTPGTRTPDSSAGPADAGPAPPLPRMTSIGVFTKVYAVPGLDGAHLGYVHFGQSVALRQSAPVGRRDCPAGWYAIAPRGFVCNDTTVLFETEGRRVPPHHARLLAALAEARPAAGALPFRYAVSLGTPTYGRVPSVEERARYEVPLEPATRPTRFDVEADEPSVTVPPASGEPPWYLSDGALSPDYVGGRESRFFRGVVASGSFVSFRRAFIWGGRTWLVTPDLALLPADRVREVKPSLFRGVEIGGALQLPIAWIRTTARPKYRRVSATDVEATDELWPRRTAVGLTGRTEASRGRVLLETTEPGAYIDANDATVVTKSAGLPTGVAPGEKWLQISIGAGTLTAYEGREPVFATLISAGRGGAPKGTSLTNRQLVAQHASPLGTYRIQYKERYSVMSPDRAQKTFALADVPYVQYFRGPFALHAAYWHDDFGSPKSAGCINLAPEDAARLFTWTDPPVPRGWHSAQSSKANGRGTRIQIIR